jgi:hypothetical protein
MEERPQHRQWRRDGGKHDRGVGMRVIREHRPLTGTSRHRKFGNRRSSPSHSMVVSAWCGAAGGIPDDVGSMCPAAPLASRSSTYDSRRFRSARTRQLARQHRWSRRTGQNVRSHPGQTQPVLTPCNALAGRLDSVPANQPTLRFQPGPARFAGRSTTNFLLPAACWGERNRQRARRAPDP